MNASSSSPTLRWGLSAGWRRRRESRPIPSPRTSAGGSPSCRRSGSSRSPPRGGESPGNRRREGSPGGQTPARAVGVTDQPSQVQLYQDGPPDKIYTFIKWRKGNLAMPGGKALRDLFEAEFEGTIGALWDAGRRIVGVDVVGWE